MTPITERLLLMNQVAIMTTLRTMTVTDDQLQLLGQQINASLIRIEEITAEAKLALARAARDGSM